MAVVNLTKATLDDTINDNDIVLIDWWAEWCGPCKSFAPIYDEAADKHDDIVFGKVDTEEETGLASDAGIRSIPTLMAFREGILLFSQAGALPSAALEDLISQVRALDMDEVRKEIEFEEVDDPDAAT